MDIYINISHSLTTIAMMMMQRYCDLQRRNSSSSCYSTNNDIVAILQKKNNFPCSSSTKLAMSQKSAFSTYLPHYRTLTSFCNTTKPGMSYDNFFL